MDIEHVFDDGEDCDLDDFEFDLDLGDETVQSEIPKRRRRRRVGPVVVSSTPVKGDIRRYLPQLMVSVINSTDFTKLHTFFQTFMESDGRYDLEYRGVQINPVSRSRGPELTAFMFAGMGVVYPDMALETNNITITTNNLNAVSTITMDCSFNFSKLYDVTLDWALTQLQAAYQANQPSPFRDLHVNPLDLLSVGKGGDKGVKKRTRSKVSKKEKESFIFTIPSFSGVFGGSVPALRSAPLALPLFTQPLLLDECDASTSTSACSSAPSSARSSESGKSDSAARNRTRANTSTSSSIAASSYDLSPLALSVFTNVPQLPVPITFFVHSKYTITLDGNRIRSIYCNATVQPPKGTYT